MNKIEFLEELKKLTDTTEYLKASRSVSELRGKFEDFLIEEERLRQVALLEAKKLRTTKKLTPFVKNSMKFIAFFR
jgi:hypothetical protein